MTNGTPVLAVLGEFEVYVVPLPNLNLFGRVEYSISAYKSMSCPHANDHLLVAKLLCL